MFVDTLLRMIGDNPDAYVQTSDKWIEFSSRLQIFYIYPYLPYVLFIAPWIYLFIQRKKHAKDFKKFLSKIILFSIGGLVIGFVIPYLVLAILASLAAYSMYGGTI